jgi:hypothetical protein
MLWEVTDLDTDVLTTEFLSQWVPNSDKPHWKTLDKTQWKKGEKGDAKICNSLKQMLN